MIVKSTQFSLWLLCILFDNKLSIYLSLGHSYFDAQNSCIKSVSPLALILWGASYTWKNKRLFFLTAMDAPDIAKGSPTTLRSQWGSFLDSYSRPTWSATKTSRLLFIKIKQNDVTFVMLLLLLYVCCVLFSKMKFFSNFVPSLENQQPHTELPCLRELK